RRVGARLAARRRAAHLLPAARAAARRRRRRAARPRRQRPRPRPLRKNMIRSAFAFALALAFAFAFAPDARANRPTQALEADRQSAEAEVRDLERRAHALDEQAAQRQDRLRQRVRALYKLSSGGYLRLLAGAESAAELATRHQAIGRVLARDLEELQAVREEAAALGAPQARHADQLARALALGRELRLASEDPPTGLEARCGKLPRPVPGPIVGAFGAFRDPELGLE